MERFVGCAKTCESLVYGWSVALKRIVSTHYQALILPFHNALTLTLNHC